MRVHPGQFTEKRFASRFPSRRSLLLYARWLPHHCLVRYHTSLRAKVEGFSGEAVACPAEKLLMKPWSNLGQSYEGKVDRRICCHHVSIPCPLIFPFSFIICPPRARLSPYAAIVQARSVYHCSGPLACVIIMTRNCSPAASSNRLWSS